MDESILVRPPQSFRHSSAQAEPWVHRNASQSVPPELSSESLSRVVCVWKPARSVEPVNRSDPDADSSPVRSRPAATEDAGSAKQRKGTGIGVARPRTPEPARGATDLGSEGSS